MIKNIVFDMGKVLVDYEPAKVCRQLGLTRQECDEICEALFASKEWVLLDRGDITEKQAMDIVTKRLPDPHRKEMAQKCMEQWHLYNMTPVEGMRELLVKLKAEKYRLYILSNAPLRFRKFQHIIPGVELFDGIVVSAEENCIKPEPKIYHRLFEKYGLNPTESFFVDDREENIAGAKACGMDGYCFTNLNINALTERLSLLNQ